jgi:diguanylate cyclase (GGDEF)-like protein
MFLDLDNFKPLNDTHGHEVGEQLLVEVARRLNDCVRDTDTVARFATLPERQVEAAVAVRRRRRSGAVADSARRDSGGGVELRAGRFPGARAVRRNAPCRSPA